MSRGLFAVTGALVRGGQECVADGMSELLGAHAGEELQHGFGLSTRQRGLAEDHERVRLTGAAGEHVPRRDDGVA